MRKLVAACVLVVVAFTFTACGNDEAVSTVGTETAAAAHDLAHDIPSELVDRVNEDVVEDMEIISSVTVDTASFSLAMTGEALTDMNRMAADDLAAGKYRKRDYRDVSVLINGYISPVVEARVEFDDYGYYVDVSTGEALESPSGERKTFAMALVEEDGQWKIKGIYSPTGTETASPLAQ
ncbi:hypothetical protein BMS3Abin01_01199 [bacterium BMS3Abin01]|nr:hypothetical protein BMS3Abin01_01199 [bacterium BMS3Abin01]